MDQHNQDSARDDKSPAFQYYPKDYLSDAKTRAMTFKQRGMYWELVSHCWLEGSLPADPKAIARILGITAVARFEQHDWPALAPCFRSADEGSLHHPRLEMERRKQARFHSERSEAGRSGAEKRWGNRETEIAKPSSADGSATKEPLAKNASSSSVFSLQSATAVEKTLPPVDARSKRPIFRGQRITVFEWMLDDLRRLLGSHTEGFDLHAWFFDLDSKAAAAEVVVPQRDGGKWLQEQTLAEAVRRGLPVVASTHGTGKTAGNSAAAHRFIARGAQ